MTTKPYRRGRWWRLCPYSTAASEDIRIPDDEKSEHTTTSGCMRIIATGRFRCDDDNCSFYTGAASTSIEWKKWVPNRQTVVSGTITPQAGVRFTES